MTFVELVVFLLLPYVALGQLVPAFLWLRWGGGRVFDDREVPLAQERSVWFWPALWVGGGFVLLLHVAGVLLPALFAALVARPVRLLAVETLGLTAGLALVFALGVLSWRRLRVPALTPLRTAADLGALGLLFASALAGVGVATQVRWGAAWFPSVVSPYVRSLLTLSPDASAIAATPLLVRLHVVTALLSLVLFPYTSLPRQLVRSLSRSSPRPAGLTGGA